MATQTYSEKKSFDDQFYRDGSGECDYEQYMERGKQQLREMMDDKAGRTVLISLAAGFGLGLVLGRALGGSSRSSSRWSDRIAAEGLGRRLMEGVEAVIPDALSKHLPS